MLDLFAGSGQLGLEALSRGAREAVFVDAGKEPISIVEKNLANTGLGEHAKVLAYGLCGVPLAAKRSL